MAVVTPTELHRAAPTQIVWVFESLDSNYGFAMEAEGLVPWGDNVAACMHLDRDGNLQPFSGEQPIGPAIVAAVERCPPPHAEWARVRVFLDGYSPRIEARNRLGE